MCPRTFNLHPNGTGCWEKCEGMGIWAEVEEDPGEEVEGFEAMLEFTGSKHKKDENKKRNDAER